MSYDRPTSPTTASSPVQIEKLGLTTILFQVQAHDILKAAAQILEGEVQRERLSVANIALRDGRFQTNWRKHPGVVKSAGTFFRYTSTV